MEPETSAWNEMSCIWGAGKRDSDFDIDSILGLVILYGINSASNAMANCE
jgi:hypothetical protein